MGQCCSCLRSEKKSDGACIEIEEHNNPEEPCDEDPYDDVQTEDETDSEVEKVAMVTAMHDYNARSENELSFVKGDLLEVLEKSNSDWWLARFPKTTREGYIPVPFTAASSSLEAQDWYYGDIPRVQAEELLLSPLNSHGAFLIRKNQSGQGYAISILVERPLNKGSRVKHYLIVVTDAGHFYFTGCENLVFHTLNDLLDHYKNDNNAGIGRLMKFPCKRYTPNITSFAPHEERFEIRSEDIIFKEEIGQGNFGNVYKGSINGITVAVKVLKEGVMTKEQFLEEALIMKRLHHENVLGLHAVSADETVMIITELMSEGSLLDTLRRRGKDSFDLTHQVYIAKQVANGMAYLERQHLIHRDLAARNVLLGPSLSCKVADFGLARLCYNEYNLSSEVKFPVKWTAPEALTHGRFSIKSDVWSFGILVMEIVTGGAQPYAGMCNSDVCAALQRDKNFHMARPQECDKRLYEEILNCWHRNPDMRPTFDHLLDFLTQFEVECSGMYYGDPIKVLDYEQEYHGSQETAGYPPSTHSSQNNDIHPSFNQALLRHIEVRQNSIHSPKPFRRGNQRSK